MKIRQVDKRHKPLKNVRCQISLPPGVLKELDELALEAEMSRSGVISFLTLLAGTLRSDESKDLIGKGVKHILKEAMK